MTSADAPVSRGTVLDTCCGSCQGNDAVDLDPVIPAGESTVAPVYSDFSSRSRYTAVCARLGVIGNSSVSWSGRF
jgi:hypothetical protein